MLNVGLRYSDPETGSLLHIGATTLFYWIISPFFVENWYWLTIGTLLFGVVGLFRPVISANLSLQGVHFLGPTLTSTLAATSPLFGILFGVTLLGETLTSPIIFGTAAIMAGTIVMAQRQGGKANWKLWAIMLPLGAAFFRSFGHILTKYGYDFVSSAFFASMISYSVSFFVAWIAYHIRGKSLAWQKLGVIWFSLAGVINGLSVLSLNTALKIGDVITVVPIVSSSPVITLLLSIFLFRREIITKHTIFTVCLVVPGVIIIAAAE